MTVDESVLTGESVPVEKSISLIIGDNLQLQQQANMVFSSTFVSTGSGKAVVTATGVRYGNW